MRWVWGWDSVALRACVEGVCMRLGCLFGTFVCTHVAGLARTSVGVVHHLRVLLRSVGG